MIRWDEIARYADHRERGVLLLRHADELTDEDYWCAVAAAWQDCERQPLTRAEWRRLWTAERDRRDLVMNEQEHVALAALPDRVDVFRGVHAYNEISGLSWTLDRERAEWFARRFDGAGFLIEARVLRSRALAFFDARGEQEIVVFPKHVYGRRWRRINPSP